MRKIDQRKTLEFLALMDSLEHLYPELSAAFNRALELNWDFAVVKQNHGYCNWGRKEFCIPTFIFSRPRDYQLYYLAHELTHIFAGSAAKHGPLFMEHFKQICPNLARL